MAGFATTCIALIVAAMTMGCGLIGGRSVTPLALTPEGALSCRFTVGFREFRAAIPDVVGDCIENERTDARTGDILQRTSSGLLVWRKADGWIAFTNGTQTWIRGPSGIEVRANSERFPWEALPTPTQTPTPGLATVTPTPGAGTKPTQSPPPKPTGAPAKKP